MFSCRQPLMVYPPDPNEFNDDAGFEPFFTDQDMLEQHCRLLETELAELHSELRVSREKIATLVLMWSAETAERLKVEKELLTTREALEYGPIPASDPAAPAK